MRSGPGDCASAPSPADVPHANGGARSRALLLSLVLLPGVASALSPRPEGRPAAKRVVGVVRVVGSEPGTRVVVTESVADGPGRDHVVSGPLAAELRKNHQGRAVALEGSACPAVPPGFDDCIVATRILPAR